MNREEAAQKYKHTTINGINCGTVKAGFMPTACNEMLIEQSPLIHTLVDRYPRFPIALQGIDRNYDLLNEREITPSTLQKDANNKAQIIGKLSHHIKLGGRNPSEVFQSYGDIGIVPSEYFGILESGREACFCTSFARIYEYDTNADPLRNSRSMLTQEGLFKRHLSRRFGDNPSENVYFILDEQIYKDIENNNFFALKNYPDDSKEKADEKQAMYDALPPDQQLLYDAITAVSRGVSTHEESEWFAYPGGIPSKYINGIVMDSMLTTSDPNLSIVLEKAFPQATIIDIKDNSIIREPILAREQE